MLEQLMIGGVYHYYDVPHGGFEPLITADLKQWCELWENIYDSMMAMERCGEPSMPLEDFEPEFRAEGLINE